MVRTVFGVLLPVTISGLSAGPSVRPSAPLADTLYALAVDSTEYPRESFIFLLDDGVVRFEPDGRGSRTYRQVVQILKEDAIERWAEFSFGYAPSHEKLTVNWVKVIGPDGSLISDKPGIAQDADVPAPMGDPTYQERKVRRISMPNVRPGTLVDYSYTIEELKPYRPGDFFTGWRVNPGTLVRRSRFVLETPVTLQPRVKLENIPFEPKVVTAAGRRTTTWATQEVPVIEPELFAADSNGVDMRITVGGPSAWTDIGAWYAGLAKDRYTLTPELERTLARLVSGARTIEDSLRAVHRYVARDVRYVAIALGMGGYQPRSPAEVLATGYGDCKDKATIFIAMATRMGVRARPVLLAAGGKVERGLPSIYQFNHAIAAVERPSGRLFVDLTASDVPWGALPVADQGQFVLVIDPDGRTEETMTPDFGRDAMNDLTVTATLDTAGYATARTEMAVGGAFGNSLREMFTRAADSAQRASFLREAASGIYPEAEGTDLRLTDRLDSGGPFTIGFTAKNGRGAQLAGPVAILGTPFLRLGRDVKPLIAQLKERSPRKFTIDVAQVGAGGEGTVRFRLELPEGWKAELPKNVSLESAFGELDITYSQEGRTFMMVMRRNSKTGIEPPESLPKLIAWLEQVAAAERDAAGIVVRKG